MIFVKKLENFAKYSFSSPCFCWKSAHKSLLSLQSNCSQAPKFGNPGRNIPTGTKVECPPPPGFQSWQRIIKRYLSLILPKYCVRFLLFFESTGPGCSWGGVHSLQLASDVSVNRPLFLHRMPPFFYNFTPNDPLIAVFGVQTKMDGPALEEDILLIWMCQCAAL